MTTLFERTLKKNPKEFTEIDAMIFKKSRNIQRAINDFNFHAKERSNAFMKNDKVEVEFHEKYLSRMMETCSVKYSEPILCRVRLPKFFVVAS